jgi:colanic acid biosynthesis glycosyl transferase WcaI
MRLLILGLNYLPESTSIGPYTADLAGYLRELGHEVQVITGFPMAPQWKVWEGYAGKWFMREAIQRVPVVRTFLYVPTRPGRTLDRILFDTSFAVSALLGGLTTGRCDLVVVISPPLQAALSGWLLARCRGAGLFIHLQDLVPDVAVAAGMLGEKNVPFRIARALERFVYRRARGVGVICDGFAKNLLAKGVPESKIALLPNHVDVEFIQPLERYNSFRMTRGIKRNEFLVMYSGSIGRKQGLHTFVDSAAAFKADEGIIFYVVGEGPYLPELTARAAGLGCPAIRFLPLQPKDGLPFQLSAANALVITQRRAVTDAVFPGKLLYYMASGRPIVAAVSEESETGRFVKARQVGLVVPPEEPGLLAQAIRFLRDSPEEAERLGGNGRRVAEEEFDRRVVLKRFARHLESLVARAGRAGLPGDEVSA